MLSCFPDTVAFGGGYDSTINTHTCFTFGLEAVKDHCLAAAPDKRPGWSDKHPGEGVCGGGVQGLGQTEEVGGLSAAHIRLPLVTFQR